MADWIIFRSHLKGSLEPAIAPSPTQGHNFIQPPRIESREEFERFIEDLHGVAGEVWPVEETAAEKPGEDGFAATMERAAKAEAALATYDDLLAEKMHERDATERAFADRVDVVCERIAVINTDVDKPSARQDWADLSWACRELRSIERELRSEG
jgi:hypothetical protein